MKIAVFDTYVQRPDGRTMHFDILVRDDPTSRSMEIVLAHGKSYLATKGIQHASLSARECRFCHIETGSPAVEQDVARNGFAIIEMEHCD